MKVIYKITNRLKENFTIKVIEECETLEQLNERENFGLPSSTA